MKISGRKKKVAKGAGNCGVAGRTTYVFRDPEVFAVPTLWIRKIEIVLRKRELAQAVFRVHWR